MPAFKDRMDASVPIWKELNIPAFWALGTADQHPGEMTLTNLRRSARQAVLLADLRGTRSRSSPIIRATSPAWVPLRRRFEDRPTLARQSSDAQVTGRQSSRGVEPALAAAVRDGR